MTAVYGLPMDEATKAELQKLKKEHKVDTNAWLRSLIRAELPKLKKAVSA